MLPLRRTAGPVALASARWCLLALTVVALLFTFAPGDSDSDVSDECREARDRATVFVRFPSPKRLEELRRSCGSAR